LQHDERFLVISCPIIEITITMRSALVLLLASFVSSVVAIPQGKGKGKGGGPIVSPYQKDDSGGSGPYKAHYVADPGLPDHTIYAPKTPPKEPMPLIVWGEGKI
jgi:hypothetical protein